MATVDYYELEWDTDPGEPYANTETIPPGEPLEFTTPAVAEGTAIYGRIRAVSTDGFAGPWSAEVSALVEIPPPPPTSTPFEDADILAWDQAGNTVSTYTFSMGSLGVINKANFEVPAPTISVVAKEVTLLEVPAQTVDTLAFTP